MKPVGHNCVKSHSSVFWEINNMRRKWKFKFRLVPHSQHCFISTVSLLEKGLAAPNYHFAIGGKIFWRVCVSLKSLRGTFKASVGNFGVNINNFLCSIWKKCPNTPKQLLVTSDEVWEYREMCFPIMPLYSALVKILSLPFYLPNHWCSLCSLSWLAS